jgi:hypothetical protein
MRHMFFVIILLVINTVSFAGHKFVKHVDSQTYPQRATTVEDKRVVASPPASVQMPRAQGGYLLILPSLKGHCDQQQIVLMMMPQVLYVTHHPDQITGNMSLEKFMKTFKRHLEISHPRFPKATLSVLQNNGSRNALIEIKKISLQKNRLTLSVRYVSGQVPASFKAATLFIDEVNSLVYMS